MASTTIQIRVDEKIKSVARRKLESMGLDLSSGINLYLRNLANSSSVTLNMRTENGFTPEYERRILNSVKEARNSGARYTDVRKMLKEI